MATYKELRELLERYDHKCAITGVPLEPDETEFDHIDPRSSSGDNSIANIIPMAKQVNQMKGTMSIWEFKGWIERCYEGLQRWE